MPCRTKKRRGLRTRPGWALFLCLLLGGLPHAHADTNSDLTGAEGRLARLEQRAAAAQALASRTQADLLRVLGALSSRQDSFQTVQQQLMGSRERLQAV